MEIISLAVMRLQPLHKGHELLIKTMLENSSKVIIGIGSTQDVRTQKNPYSYDERKRMLDLIFTDERLLSISLKDINAPTKAHWAKYVLNEVKERLDLSPTHYYAGSQEDVSWFDGFLKLQIVDRHTLGGGINATSIRNHIDTSHDKLNHRVLEYIKGIR